MRFHRFPTVFRYTWGARTCVVAPAACLLVPVSAAGQANPVPYINQPLVLAVGAARRSRQAGRPARIRLCGCAGRRGAGSTQG